MSREVDLLNLLMGKGKNKNSALGLRIVRVDTVSPLRFIFEGTTSPVDAAIFEIPEDFTPLQSIDRFFALPILDTEGQRWGLITRLNKEVYNG